MRASVNRSACRTFALTLPLFFVSITSSGCAHSMLSGSFVNRDNPVEVDMLRLVESPAGHLSGSLVISSLNVDGSRKKDAIADVSGTMTGQNVSLQVDGGLASLAELFGTSTNLVGSLKGNTLTLSAGNQTEIFREMSPAEYGDALVNLDKIGQHAAMVEQANSALRAVESNDQRLNADLQKYIDWGQQRVNHVSDVRQWYANRTTRYTKCLQSIRPLASQGIPSWRWQDCVLSVENDKYDRDQENKSVAAVQGENSNTTANLDARISAEREQFAKMLDEMKSACPYAKDVHACDKEFQKLNSLPADAFLDKDLIASYRSMIPKVNSAISADTQAAATGDSNLTSLALQVEKIYQSAR